MQDLFDRIQNYKCQQHQQPIERICIEVNCKHLSRGLCRKCPKTEPTNEANLYSLFDFIDEQLLKSTEMDSYRTKAMVFQQFLRLKVLIVEYLDQLQVQLESAFYSTSESFINELNNWKIEAQKHSVATQELGELFSKTIQTSSSSKLELSGEIVQSKVNDANGLIEEMYVLGINYKQKKQQLLDSQQLLVSQAYCEYKILKTINVDGSCGPISFNHDETQLVAASEKGEIYIFNLSATGVWTQCDRLQHNQKAILQVKFNHNATQIASGQSDGQIIIWRKQLDGQWSIQDTLQRNKSPVLTICLNHTSTLMVSGTQDKLIQIYEFNNGRWEHQQVLIEHADSISHVCFNNDSTLLASGSEDKSLILWEQNKSRKWAVKQKLTGHTDSVDCCSFNSISTLLVTGSKDCLIKVWSVDDKKTWKCNYTLTGHTNHIVNLHINQLSNMIVSGDATSIKIWEQQQGIQWECAQTIVNSRNTKYGTIINKDNHIFSSSFFYQTIISIYTRQQLIKQDKSAINSSILQVSQSKILAK